MIDFSHVTKTYRNGDVVLDDIDFSVSPGEFVVITGKSGAGKTTLGRLLIRDLLPTKGKIVIDGEDLAKIKIKNIPQFRRKIGFIFQDYKIIPDKTVGENISFALEMSGHRTLGSSIGKGKYFIFCFELSSDKTSSPNCCMVISSGFPMFIGRE